MKPHDTIRALCIVTFVLLASCGKKDDPKASVGSVRTQLDDELKTSFLQLVARDELPSGVEESLLAVANSERAGSGFLVAGHEQGDGSLFITNKHVIQDGECPQITFNDGKTVSMSEVLYKDPSHDLAILLFDKSDKKQKGLKLATTYADSDTVSALGYPVTGTTGTFQITKGTISDRCIKERTLNGIESDQDGESCWIKHTAEFDRGSSGGPLIKASGTIMGTSASVVGVNTAYLPDKNAVFLAVPSEAIEGAIEQAELLLTQRSNEPWRRERLRKICQAFLSEITSSKPNATFLSSHLASSLLAEYGYTTLRLLMTQMDFPERIHYMDSFKEHPLEIYRAALLTLIKIMLSNGDGVSSEEQCDHVSRNDDVMKPDGAVRIRISLKNKDAVELIWVFKNEWLLRDFNALK